MYKKSKKRKTITAIVVVIVLAAMVVTTILASLGTASASEKDDVIADRIYIGDVSVGGMTVSEAEDAVQEYISGLADKKVTLKVQDKKIKVKAEDLGLTWSNTEVAEEAGRYGKSGNLIARYKASKDLEHENKVFTLSLAADEGKLTSVLEERAEDLNREAVDFGLKREDGEFQITGGKDGIEVNVQKSVDAVNEYLAQGWQDKPSIEIVADITKPQGSEEQLKKVKDVLGSYSTNYATSAWGRKQNIANGSSLINGSVIYPGEEFSVYETVSPMDKAHGYELAGAYENGTTVEAYGGGICQVSTTLYNAVIRAELEITERSGHSMLVSYVDPSADAAIAGSYKDLKFKNNLSTPIYIEGYADGSTLTFKIYGEETRPANREVSFISETLSTTQPTVQFKATGAEVGTVTKTQSSHTGKTARLWKVVTVDGVEESREIFNKTSYKMSPTIYEVGTSSSNKEAVAAMKEAIKSQDEATIKAAAAKWNAEALKKEEEKKKAEEEKKKKEEAEKKKKEEAKKNYASSQTTTGEQSAETPETSQETAEE